MHHNLRPRPLSDHSGTELLILAIAGTAGQRRQIETELNLRALLAEGPRRRRLAPQRPRLRLVPAPRAA